MKIIESKYDFHSIHRRTDEVKKCNNISLLPEVERRFSTMYPRRCTPPVSEGGVQVRVTDLEVTSFTLTLGLPGKPTDIMW